MPHMRMSLKCTLLNALTQAVTSGKAMKTIVSPAIRICCILILMLLGWMAIDSRSQAAETRSDVKPTSGSDEYRLAPGDKLGILVFDQAQLTGDYVINGDGQVLLPLAGSVIVAGLTLTEAFHRASRAVEPGGQQSMGATRNRPQPRSADTAGGGKSS